jgi:hypothetical protein
VQLSFLLLCPCDLLDDCKGFYIRQIHPAKYIKTEDYEKQMLFCVLVNDLKITMNVEQYMPDYLRKLESLNSFSAYFQYVQ